MALDLRKNETLYQALTVAIADGVIVVQSANREIVAVNPAAERILGRTAEQLLGHSPEDLMFNATREDGTRFPRNLYPTEIALSTGVPQTDVVMGVHKSDGNLAWISVNVQPLMADGELTPYAVLSTLRDITTQRRLNRELRAVSNCNQTLLHAKDEQTLLNDICRIVCDEAGYRMAWVGYREHDAAKTIRPVAWAGGVDPGLYARLRSSWADTEDTIDIAGSAIRCGQTACIQNVFVDPRAEPWRNRALQQGFHSLIALPLKDESPDSFGVLVIFSMEVDAFTAEEVRLLEELAGDLAFGIGVLRARIDQRRLEQQRQATLHFFSCMDRINRAMQETHDLEQMMRSVLDEVFAIFDCDRAWMVYPCDPEAATFSATMERFRPEYPGLWSVGRVIPIDAEDRSLLRTVSAADGPVPFGPGSEHPLPKSSSEQFGVQAMLAVAIHPKGDKAYMFGLTQCSYARVWTAEEQKLLQAIGWRLADGLTSLLAHRQLQQNEARLRAVVHTIPDLVWLKDPAGVYLGCNAQVERLFGVREAEIVGKTDYDFVDKEAADCFCESDRKAMTANKSCTNEGWLTTADGYRGLFETIKTPMLDQQGKLIGVLGIARDMTERKQAEAALRESEAKYRRIVDTAAEGIWLVGPDEKTEFVNTRMADMLGYSKDELIGRRAIDFIVMEMPGRNRRMEARRQGIPENYELRFRRKDGQILWASVCAISTFDDEHRFQGALGMVTDITERRQAESERQARQVAEAANLAKREFLATMSHEIRTPMNAIIGMSYLALGSGLNAKQHTYVSNVHRSAQSLLGIINDILDFSKIEAGKLQMDAVGFDLGDVLENLANMVGQQAEEKGLELMYVEPPQLPTRLVGDPLRLGQVLVNLVNNAVKFTERGEISVSVEVIEREAAGVQLRFGVRDTGGGISAEQQQHLFQPFSQADASTSRRYGGSGLGLAICSHLVRLMGGALGVDSAPGRGSHFFFTARFGLQAGKSINPLPLQLEALSGARVLVVDDNAAAREVIVGISRALGLKAEAAADGVAALASVAQASECGQPYDLVFLDWKMPGMDGMECARQLASGSFAHPPTVLMLTAFGRDAALQQLAAQRTKVSGVLTKPVTPSGLVDACAAALGRAPRECTRSSLREEVRHDREEQLAGAHILLVEDNAINQDLAVELLSGIGIEVTVANDGRQALALLECQRFDGVLMDCQMPDMDGYEATRLLRLQPQLQKLPVIAMTANVMSGDREKVLAAGMNDHIGKPINVEEVFATLARWVHPAGGSVPTSPTACA